jgi:hypothetical protein
VRGVAGSVGSPVVGVSADCVLWIKPFAPSCGRVRKCPVVPYVVVESPMSVAPHLEEPVGGDGCPGLDLVRTAECVDGVGEGV